MKEKQMDLQFDYSMYNCIGKLIPEIPKDLDDKLKLWCTTLGGLGREDIKGKYIEEHQKAFFVCRERTNKILHIINYLNDLYDKNQKIIGCLRNTYKAPYDPQSFIDAWGYFAAVRGYYTYFTEKYFNEHKIDLEKNYNNWIDIFYKIMLGINAFIKNFGQFEDRSKGYISFYIPKYVGCFNITFPQNITTDFGDNDQYNDMMMSISYSAPGDGNVVLKCLDYKTICRSYSFEGLNKKFIEKINTNFEHNTFKTENDYIEKYKKDFKKYIDKKEYEKDNTSKIEDEFAQTLLWQMKQYKCDVLETPKFKEILNNALDTIRKESYGDDYKKEDK